MGLGKWTTRNGNLSLAGIKYWRGDWDYPIHYVAGDGIHSTADGSAYICILEHNSALLTQPGVGANWHTYWQVLVNGQGSIAINQTGHGFSVGEYVKSSGVDGEYDLAQADTLPHAQGIGFVVDVDGSDAFTLFQDGYLENAAVVPNLPAGTVLFLDAATPGAVTDTVPVSVGQILKPVAIIAVAGQAMWVLSDSPTTIGSGGGGGGGSQITARAFQDASPQSIPLSTVTKVVFDTESFDTGNNFASNRFTATVAGYYLVTTSVYYADHDVGTDYIALIYKNGSAYSTAYGNAAEAGDDMEIKLSDIVQLGVGDYVEIFTVHGGSGANNLNNDSENTYVSIGLVSSSGGGSGITSINGNTGAAQSIVGTGGITVGTVGDVTTIDGSSVGGGGGGGAGGKPMTFDFPMAPGLPTGFSWQSGYSDREILAFRGQNTDFYLLDPQGNMQKIDVATDWASASNVRGFVLIGAYLYLELVDGIGNEVRVYRYLATNLAAGGTQMTIAGTAFGANTNAVMTSNGTHFFFSFDAGNSSDSFDISKYSISGTTLTYVSTTTCGASATQFDEGFAVNAGGDIFGFKQDITQYDSAGALQNTWPDVGTIYLYVFNWSNTFYTTHGTVGIWVKAYLPGTDNTGGSTTQIFTSNGVWSKPAGVSTVEIIAVGAGGGGGSGGANNLNNGSPVGGGGGGGGQMQRIILRASDLGNTETVTVGAGGAGGAFVSGLTDGNAGSDGTDSSFSSWIKAFGGKGGDGGDRANPGTASTGGDGGGFSTASSAISGQGGNGGANADGHPAEYGGAGGGGTQNPGFGTGDGKKGGSSLFGGAGGGGGGSASTGGGAFQSAGGNGGTGQSYAAGGGATGGPAQTDGDDGDDNSVSKKGYGADGAGGGGGSNVSGTPGGDGGQGGLPGGGGGAGGACNTNAGTTNSGNGGDGGDGIVIVRCW